MSKGSFVANVQRRTWDLQEYEEKALEKKRLEEEAEALKDAKNRNRARAQQALVVRAPLQSRKTAVEVESRLGKHSVITSSTPLAQQGGFYCEVCECLLKDSNSYLDHINGKKHQRALGMTLRAERSSLGEVRAKLEEHKRAGVEASETGGAGELERRLARFTEEMDRESRAKKDARREAAARREEFEERVAAAEEQFDLGKTTSESRKRRKKEDGGAGAQAEAGEGDEDDDERQAKKPRPEAAAASSSAAAASSAPAAAASATAACATAASSAAAAAAPAEEEDPEAAMMRAMGFQTTFADGKAKNKKK